MKRLPTVLALLIVFIFPEVGIATEIQPRFTDGPVGRSPMEGQFLTAPGSASLSEFALPIDKSARKKSAIKPEVGGSTQIGYSRRSDVERLNQAKGKSVPVWADASGGKATVLAVTSPGAQALRVGLLLETVPKGLRIRVGSKANWNTGGSAIVLTDDWMAVTYGQAPFVLWTPVSEGDQQVIEFWLPESTGTGLLNYRVEDISHIYASPFLYKAQPKLLSCEQNFVCNTNPDIQQAGKAVAKLVITTGAGSFDCSGALLNDIGSTGTPFFITANHCLSTTSEASSLQLFWFYEQACGGSTLNPAYTTSVGSQLLRTDPSNDFTFLQITGALPSGLMRLGWSTTDLNPGDVIYGVHHPAGSPKGFSTGALNTILPSLTFRNTSGQSWNITSNQVYWQTGITEPGSSGSPLMTGAGIFRGSLSAGPTNQTCTSSPRIGDYSRFSQIYPQIQFWLNPAAAIPDEANSAAATFTSQPNDYTTVAINAQINFAGDQDWFRFNFLQRGVWLVFTTNSGSLQSIDTIGRVYGSDGVTVQLENDDDPSIAPNFFIAGHGGPGTFFVQVTGKGSTTGKYILVSLFVPDDDHSNFFQLADPLAPNSTAAGTISYGGDSDKFAIDITSSGTLKIESSGSTDVVGFLYNSSRQLVTWNDDIVQGVNRNFSFTANVAPGRYYLDVIGYDIDVTGPYNISTTFTAAQLVDTQAPTVPTGLTATVVSASAINLFWTASTDNVGVTNYKVFRNGTLLGTVNSTGAAIANLSASTTYSFAVSACDAAGNCSAQSAAVSATTQSVQSTADYTGAWYNASESGWGLSVVRGPLSGLYGIIMYHYNQSSSPTWYWMSGGTFNGNTYSVPVSLYSGPYFGGPFNPTLVSTSAVGSATINFTSATTATMTYTINGITVTKNIAKLDF